MENDPKMNDPPPKYEPPTVGFVSGHPGGYPPAQGQPYLQQGGQAMYPSTTVVIQQPQAAVINGATYRYAQYPALIMCQHCQATVTTSLTYETGLLTWAIAGGMCLLGLWLGCCLIPFCINGTKDVEHRCPNCNNVVGKFRHFG